MDLEFFGLKDNAIHDSYLFDNVDFKSFQVLTQPVYEE